LRAINDHFLQLPEEEREQGIIAFAHVPPAGNLVAELWDRFMRKGYRDEEPVKMSTEKQAQLLERFKEFRKQSTLKPRRNDRRRARRDDFDSQDGAEEERELVATAKGSQGATGGRLIRSRLIFGTVRKGF
jgi:hypothetical protein